MNNHVHLAEGDRTAVSDRALLEGAARAAGYAHTAPARDGDGIFVGVAGTRGMRLWNPLDDDGDALRLAVKLGMYLDVWPTYAVHAQASGAADCVDEPLSGDDPCAATRRAIVRAAASMGVSALSVDQADRKGGEAS
jgi:hypothetical protein